ncbi:MAG TPA: tetratricopeptide repeat protein [Polyangia bacterium]|jgi:tetratricopeptide (TPR) repeat protein|nr:tetratricopeptide repeat protein [Polyangia bacterium]
MRLLLTTAAVLMATAGAVRAEGLRAPQNVNAVPWGRESSELTTRSAKAAMAGDSQKSLELAEQAIQASPQSPWPYYNKGMALARRGQTDAAVAALSAAEVRFANADPWGRSVAIYGRANTLAGAGRCAEAREAFEQYAKFVEERAPNSAALARRYATECRAPATPPAPES